MTSPKVSDPVALAKLASLLAPALAKQTPKLHNSGEKRAYREGGLDGLRAFWRERSNRRYQRLLAEDPDAIHAKKREANRLFLQRHGPPKYPPVLCRRCHQTPAPTGRRINFVCDNCRPHCWCGKVVKRPMRFCSRPHADLAKHFGKSVSVTYGSCPECGAVFTKHPAYQRFCSKRCKQRFNQRDYQRLTHATAIRYWRIANTKEAQDLAETMFALRQEMRKRNVPLSPK